MNSYIDISLRENADFSLIDSYIKEPFFLEKFTILSDIESKSYRYLVDLKEKSWISQEDIKKVCFYLQAQNKFNTIKIELKEYNKSSKELVLNLDSRWTLAKVKVKEIILSKDKYKQNYLLLPGDVFDLELHQKGMSKIKNKLKQEGYLNSEVTESLNYNKFNKTVDVDLYINKNNRFTIKERYIDVEFKNKRLAEDHKDLKQKIKRYFLLSLKDQYYNKEDINNKIAQIKRYLASKGFCDVSVGVDLIDFNYVQSKVSLKFSIKINQEKQFVFFGNYAFDTRELLSKVLFADCLVIMPPELLKEELEKVYKELGYWQVSISIKEEGEKLFFIITEGERTKICKINLIDTKKNLIKDNWAVRVLNSTSLSFYEEAGIAKFVQELIASYQEEGYWNSKVISKSYKLLQKSDYELTINLDRGELSKVDEFIVKDHEELKYKLAGYKSLPGVLNSKLIQEHKEFLKTHFINQGYRDLTIIPKLYKKGNKNILVWNISFDKSITRFGKTVVLGDNSISSNLLLKDLDYKEDDIFDQSKIDRSINRLKSWGVFDQVYLFPYKSCFDSYQPLILNFICDDPFEVKLSSGVQYYSKNFGGYGGFTYKFGSSFLYKNPTGNADLFALSINFTRYSRRFFGCYKRPWIYGLPIYLSTKVYSLLYEQPLFFGSSSNIYKVSQSGFSFNFKHLKFTGSLDCNLGLEIMKTFDITPEVANAIEYNNNLIGKSIPYIYFEPNFFYSSFDNNLYSNYSTWGITTLFSLKGLLAFKETQTSFLKILYEQSFYMPIMGALSSAFRLRLGHIICDSIRNITPTERFYLGGSKTIRGYEPLMVPPLNKLCINNQPYWVPTGAKSMVNINSELRFPIYNNVSGVVFNDMGILSSSKFTDIKSIPWEGASGVGFRYNTLLGPVRFDIGFKWRKHLNIEKNYVWYLTLGHAF